VDARRSTPGHTRGPIDITLRDPERFVRLYSAASALAAATTRDDVLRWLVRSARSLGQGDRATFTLCRGRPVVGVVASSGPTGSGDAALEREIRVGDQPYGILLVTTARPEFSRVDEAAVDLLCVHAALAFERITLRQDSEVVRRVRTLVGEQELTAADTVRQHGDVRIDVLRHEAFVGGMPIHLTPSEFRLLELLTEEPERVYSRDEIVARLWDTPAVASPRVADVHVTRLRHKLDAETRGVPRLQTVRGIGYKFVPAGESSAEAV
jgi:hypothetical protein